jgi:hypothetical protein
MFSWLNFEELLIHNPIELINSSKDTISVAMSKKQYIEFFSNKYTYNGLYYNEEMDFCLFYYADPLQSYKEGDVYAQGYIDVEMKIYRVKWLCNVSISFPSGLLQSTDGTQGVPQEGGKYTHTAWAFSANGADRFSTIYPSFNLLKNTKSLTVTSTASWWGTLFSSEQIYDSSIKSKTGVSAMTFSFDAFVPLNAEIGGAISLQLKGQTYQAHGNVGTDDFNTIVGQFWHNIEQSDLGKTIRLSFPIQIDTKYKNFDSALADTDSIIIRQIKDTSGIVYSAIKLEIGLTNTPYMPTESETTKVDRPSYIGQYTDYTLEDSTNPSSYTWREIQEDKLNVSKTEMVVNTKNKTITTVLNGALAKCTKDKDVTGWRNSQPNENYNYRQPQYSLDIGADDFIISGFGLRGLKNG